MRYHVLVTDYDGTLADDGLVDEATLDALRRLTATGRRLMMITGRELPELMDVFPHVDLFEWVVAENGGLLFCPSTNQQTVLADPPPQDLIDLLQRQNVLPLSVGKVILATREPHQEVVLQAIRDLGLEMQVNFNKGAVMVLPAGVNKAFGLKEALKKMNLSPHEVVGVGDAENDHAFLRLCEASVAVQNALPAVKETADLVTRQAASSGVAQLIDQLVSDDLASVNQRLDRHFLAIGTRGDVEVKIPPYGHTILICGPSASGKSTVAARIVETLQEHKYQFCLIDPEGDYEGIEGAVTFGNAESPPNIEEASRLLESSLENAVVCMTGMRIPDRPELFLKLFPTLFQIRSRVGRPHWIVLDEAHHLLPAEWEPAQGSLPEELNNLVLITVHPELLAPSLLERVDTVMVLGDNADATLADFAERTHVTAPKFEFQGLQPGELLLWQPGENQAPLTIKVYPSRLERHRHCRKYAAGELPPDRSFYFRGPGDRLNLRAQNLVLFLQLGEGVDDETWAFHLRAGDYSRWIRECIKDEDLAEAIQEIERQDVNPAEGRPMLRNAVEARFTLPATQATLPGAS